MDFSGLSRLSEDDSKLRPYRIMALTIAVALPLVRFLLPSDAYDPMWQRLLLSAVFLFAGIGSWVSGYIRRIFYYISYALIFLTNIWMLELSFLNGMRVEYVTSYFLILVCSGLIFRHSRYIPAFMAGLFLFSLFLSPLLQNPEINIYYFYIIEAVAMVVISLALEMLVSERKRLEDTGESYRLITQMSFESSEQGIVILDSEGKIVLYNPAYPLLWGLSEEDLRIGEPWSSSGKIKPMLEDEESWSNGIREALEFPEKEIRQVVRLKDGRVYERNTRALIHQGQNLGRIWITRDITSLHREQEEKERSRQRLDVQNQALLNLASSPEIRTGHLESVLGRILRLAEEALQVDIAAIWLSESGESGVLKLRKSHGWTPRRETIVLGEHPEYHQKLMGARVLGRSFPRPNQQQPLFPDLGLGQCLEVPVRIGGEMVGLLVLHGSGRSQVWSDQERSFAASVGDVVALGIEAVQRNKAEAQLEESVAVLKSVFEMSGVGIVVTAYDGRILDYNSLYQEIWGLTDEMLETRSQEEIVSYARNQLESPEQSREAVQYLNQHPEENRYDQLRFKDGRIVERYTGVLQVGGEIQGRVWYFRDQTRQLKAEQALRASEQRNRALLDAVPDVMLLLDPEGLVLDSRVPELPEYRGLNPQVGSPVAVLFPEEFGEQLLAALQQVLEKKDLVALESEVLFLGRTCDLEARLVFNGPGEVLLMMRDVTQRKSVERELIQRNFELDSFVYRASHDLKAPLNSLMGLIELMRQEELSAVHSQYLGLMDRSVVKLDTFIRNLTDFSRITRKDIEHEPIDFGRIVEEVRESLQYMDQADKVDLRLDIAGDAEVIGDSFNAGVVLGNLISNAYKYQDHNKPEPFVVVRVRPGNESCLIEVEDNGIGIPEDHQDRMFELFFRASNQAFGSGLGLYITKNAVQKMGGRIEFESEEGKGTVFRVWLPNYRAEQVS